MSPALRTLLLPALIAIAIQACKGPDTAARPDPAFAPYISAFSAGHIPARSPIVVRIAGGQHWKDTVGMELQQLFEITPQVKGRVQRQDASTFAFVPDTRMEQGTTHRVSFRLGALIDVPDELATFDFQVSTHGQGITMALEDVQPLERNSATWQRYVFGVRTADAAIAEEIERAVLAEQDGRQLAIQWEHDPDGTEHRFSVDSIRRGNSASEVRLAWQGKLIGATADGELHIPVPARDQHMLLATRTRSEGDQFAELIFSDPIDSEQELDGLAGFAQADGVRLSVEGTRLLMYPRERLSGPVQAFVSEALRISGGGRLGERVTADLLFEELKPAVRFVGNGTILPSSEGTLIPFEAVNLAAVDVRIIRIHEDNVPQFLQVNRLDGDYELARVGRQVARATVPLRTADAIDPGRWNRFQLDLGHYFEAEPGAIYRVSLGFSRAHARYPCAGQESPDELQALVPEIPEDDGQWDAVQHYWYHEEWYDEDYDHRDRDDPCTVSYYGARHTVARNVLASDLGLIAKSGSDGLLLATVSDLGSTMPVAGVDLEVLDLQQRAIGRATTDAQGMATIGKLPHKPFLLVASKGEQRGYLRLDDGSSLSMSAFDVRGEAVSNGLKGMIYGERGVWRPGDSLHLTFILQDPLKTLPATHPVTLELSDPRGRIAQQHVRHSAVDGMYAFPCITSPDAPTGLWHARVRVGGSTFHKAIRIETIKPNRLKLVLDTGQGPLRVDEDRRMALRTTWLHGAPAKNLAARVTLTLAQGKVAFPGLEKYHFDDLRTNFEAREQVVFDGKLDERGHATFAIAPKTGPRAPALLRANIVTRVFEAGGEASMDQVSMDLLPYASYAGIRAPETSSWGSLETDRTHAVPIVSVDAEGKPRPNRQLQVQVYRMAHNWWWDGHVDGATNYITSPSIVLREEADLTTDAKGRAQFDLRIDRPAWGRFVVRVTDPVSGHSSALQTFMDWPGWHGRSRRTDPEQASMLTFNSDKEKYMVGETAELIIPSAGTGRALVSIESGTRVLEATWIELGEKETRFKLPITAGMVPNVHAHITLLQPHQATANDLPIRLYGVVPLFVEDPTTRLEPVLHVPKEIRTDERFRIQVGESNGRAMSYTLAVVDEGLLDLTRFRTPDPWKHFHAREALGVRTWDLYDNVIGAMGRQVQRILAVGGSDEGVDPHAVKVRRFPPVVKHLGPFRLEPGAKATHDLTINDYVGSVRVMVVAHDGDRAFGNAEQAIPVRKPLMVLATLPRVLGPGETADLPVTVFAMDPGIKQVTLRLKTNDMLETTDGSERVLRFDGPGERPATFRVRASEAVGVASIEVTAAGNGEKASQKIDLAVRQPMLPGTEVMELALAPGERWTSVAAPVGVAGSNSAYLEFSTMTPVDMGRRLGQLLGYPHGCLEQITSKAFPLLFVSHVMDTDERTKAEMRSVVEAAIVQLQRYQRNDGGFDYWPGADQYDAWSSIYATHFLVEAERQGYRIPQRMRKASTTFQSRSAREHARQPDKGWRPAARELTQAYRLFVLALANSPEQAAMNALRNEMKASPQARWVLAAAYAINGRKDVAKALTEGVPQRVNAYREQHWTYGSELRDEALVAEALMRMDDHGRAIPLLRTIADRLNGDGWYATQSVAFGLMAVSRLAQLNADDGGMAFTLTVDGVSEERTSPLAVLRQDLPPPDGKSRVTVVNTGGSLLHVRSVRSGIPMPGNEVAHANGLVMRTEYLLMDGSPMDPGSIEQGTDFMAVVNISHTGVGDTHRNLALSRIFPSGWEIRNLRMEGGGDAFDDAPFDHEDIRDDRVLTYFDLRKNRTMTYRVLLNASYVGRYYLPGAHVEAMYDRTIGAREKGRWVEVVPTDTRQPLP